MGGEGATVHCLNDSSQGNVLFLAQTRAGNADHGKTILHSGAFCPLCLRSTMCLTLQRKDLILPPKHVRVEEEHDQTGSPPSLGQRQEANHTLCVSAFVFFVYIPFNGTLKQHAEAATNMGVEELEARFGCLLKVESFWVQNPDTWPEDSLLVMMVWQTW